MDTNPNNAEATTHYSQPELLPAQPAPVKYRAWANQVQVSAVFAAVTSLLGGLSFFELGKIAVDINESIAPSEAWLGLAALLCVLALLVGRIWFEVAIIGFGFRAIQTAVAKGALFRQLRKNKPGWFIGAWFLPVYGIILPGVLLGELSEFAARADAKARKREAWIFWISWTIVVLAFSVASNSGPAQPTAADIPAAMAAFGAVSAFQAVPVMLARNLVSKLRSDIDKLV